VFNLGMGEITVILLLALIFIGPKKLPELASGLGRMIRQIRKTTADVKNEIVLDDTFRKPFEELRDAVTLAPEELKRRDALIESVRKQAEEIARSVEASVRGDDAASSATPPPEAIPPETSGPWPPPPGAAPPSPGAAATPPPPPPPLFTPPVSPPVGTFPRSPTPFPLQPGRLGGPGRVTPPFSSLDGKNANTTQTLTEEDLLPARKGAPPPLPPPLPGVAPPPPPPKKG
jgi:Sec-independent protein translocase protein TatA